MAEQVVAACCSQKDCRNQSMMLDDQSGFCAEAIPRYTDTRLAKFTRPKLSVCQSGEGRKRGGGRTGIKAWMMVSKAMIIVTSGDDEEETSLR